MVGGLDKARTGRKAPISLRLGGAEARDPRNSVAHAHITASLCISETSAHVHSAVVVASLGLPYYTVSPRDEALGPHATLHCGRT